MSIRGDYPTRVVRPNLDDLPADSFIREAAGLLRAGELVAFPTETVYGLGGNATSAEAIDRIYTAKQRPSDNPIIVHVSEVAAVGDFADIRDGRFAVLAKYFWPGPLTIVLPVRSSIAASRGLDTIALRMPSNALALALISVAGLPVAAPSANISGRPSPTTAQHVLDDLKGRIPLILDGGPCEIGIESTVLDLVTPVPQILRSGAISQTEIAAVLGQALTHAEGVALHRSPGTRYRHYKPQAKVVILGEQVSENLACRLLSRLSGGHPVGYISTMRHEGVDSNLIFRRVPDTDGGLSRCLYLYFRELDKCEVSHIVLRAQPADPAMERALRAADAVLLTDETAEAFIATLERE